MGETVRQFRSEGTALSTFADLADMRRAPRYTLLIRAAKLVTRDGEFLGIIRDVSETGISMCIFHPLPECPSCILELQNGDRYGVELVWQDEERAGFRFNTQADVARIIESPSEFEKRPVRLNISAPAQVEVDGRTEFARIQDISQQGAKIACNTTYPIDRHVQVMAAGMPKRFAKVRWRCEDTCGLVFEETLQYGELARIARALQQKD